MCREEFLHYLRIREWQDLTGQLRGIAKDLGIVESSDPEPADPASVHAALLAGLMSHVVLREGYSRDYAGARNSRFVLAPGSVLTKRPPRWIVVTDLVETSRLYGRIAARIEPEAVERVGAHLVRRTYSEPHWDAQRGEATVFERVTLYGLPLVPRRRVGYAEIEPEIARDLFIRSALVEGDWQTRHHFFRDNARLLEELGEMEERTRRRDLVVGDEEIYALYDGRVPAEVVSARHFDAWWREQRHRTPDLLTFTRDELLRNDEKADQPDTWQSGDLSSPVSYRFEPAAEDDGLTVHVPVDVLARLGGDEFAWQVPALREELVIALIRSLPKDLRRNFVPAPDTARAVVALLELAPDVAGSPAPGPEPLLEAVAREPRRRTGVIVPLDAFDLDKLPACVTRNAAARADRRGHRHHRTVTQALPTGFVTATGATHLTDLTRYLTAIGRRLDRLPHGVDADRGRMLQVHAVQDAYDELIAAPSPGRASADDVRDIARLIEELRVSLWAQQLGTARPVSEQRINQAIDAIHLQRAPRGS